MLHFLVEVVTFPVPGSLFMLIRLTAGGLALEGWFVHKQRRERVPAEITRAVQPIRLHDPHLYQTGLGKVLGGGVSMSAISASVHEAVWCGMPNLVLLCEMTGSSYGNNG